MQPRKHFRYPNPPPSLIIKPSACNSPSRMTTKKTLDSASSTPERMRIGQSLASHVYLGEFPLASNAPCSSGSTEIESSSGVGAEDDMDMLLVIQNSPQHLHNGLQRSNTESVITGEHLYDSERANHMTSSLDEKTLATILHREEANPTEFESCQYRVDNSNISRQHGSTIIESRGLSGSPLNGALLSTPKHQKLKLQAESVQKLKSNLRNNFFENYTSHIQSRPKSKARTQSTEVSKPMENYKVKKKVTFKLPVIERDISDLSISSHLSAAAAADEPIDGLYDYEGSSSSNSLSALHLDSDIEEALTKA